MPRSRSKVARELQQVTQMMASARVGRSRSRGPPPGQPSRSRGRTPSRGRARSRSRGRTPGPNSRQPAAAAGEILSVNTELLMTVKLDEGATTKSWLMSLVPSGADFSAGHLKALSKIYRRYKYTSLRFQYFGSVGSTVGGTFAMGYSYDKVTLPTTGFSWATVTASAPNVSGAIWKNSTMTVPIAKMNPQRWFETDGEGPSPGYLMVKVECSEKGKETGYIRVSYSCHLAGPNI